MEDDSRPTSSQPPRSFEENLELIKRWEQESLQHQSRIERLSGRMTSLLSRGSVLVTHLIVMAAWVLVNLELVPGVRSVDPFPFPLLTMAVSLEALLLSLFVLASQNRLSLQADKRAHLDLQVNLLAEREMTAMLQMLRGISDHLGVAHTVPAPTLTELARETDVQQLATEIEARVGGDS